MHSHDNGGHYWNIGAQKNVYISVNLNAASTVDWTATIARILVC